MQTLPKVHRRGCMDRAGAATVPQLIVGFYRSLYQGMYIHFIEFDIPMQIRSVILNGKGELSGKMMFSTGGMDVALFERSQNKKS